VRSPRSIAARREDLRKAMPKESLALWQPRERERPLRRAATGDLWRRVGRCPMPLGLRWLTRCGTDFFLEMGTELEWVCVRVYRVQRRGHKKPCGGSGEGGPRYICQCRCKLCVAVGPVVL
jgi:hypothetical protein